MTIAKPIAEDTYSPRERSFVIGSALLGYVFDFYDLIIMAFSADLVIQGVEAVASFCLRFRVQRRLQFLNTLRS
jgi:hypothetical protein